jgi:SAM-dependent methyltransferase
MSATDAPRANALPYSLTAASLYDELTGSHLRNVTRLIRRLAPRPGVCIDVGCGTGALIESLAASRWNVIGFDPSDSMISVAKARRPGLDLRVGDAASFTSDSPATLITATSDVINHLGSSRAVAAFLRRAAAALSPGGLLIFDSLTPYDIDRNWPGYCECTRRRDWCLTRTARRVGSGRGCLTYDFFAKQADGRYVRTVESHSLAAWPASTLVALLRSSGFENIVRLDAATLKPPARSCVRWLFAAKLRSPRCGTRASRRSI